MTTVWEQRKLGDFVTYTSSSLSVKDAQAQGEYDLYDANKIIGKTDKVCISEEYITVIKDGAGVGRIRRLPKNSMFIGTMGALTTTNSDLEFVYSLLSRFDLTSDTVGTTIPHIYFKDYGKNKYFIPTEEEQKELGKFFKELDHLITLHQRKCDELQNLKKFMLQNMFV